MSFLKVLYNSIPLPIPQMAKNKGLTPKRKKIDRNPRVKHREKFRRAKVRRKGQVCIPDTDENIYYPVELNPGTVCRLILFE